MSLATCGYCKAFTVPWGDDHVGPALMAAHQKECPGRAQRDEGQRDIEARGDRKAGADGQV